MLLLLYSSSSPSRAAPKKEEKEETRDFYSDREAMIEAEDQSFLGADIVLSSLVRKGQGDGKDVHTGNVPCGWYISSSCRSPT